MLLLSNRRPLFTLVSISLGLLAVACSSTSPSATGGAGGSQASSSSASSAGGSGGAAAVAPTFLAHLDPMKGELPEGLFVNGDHAYVGLAALGKILSVDLTSGAVTDFGSIPAPAMNDGFLLGIVADAAGNVYVGFGNGTDTVVKNGVYKIPAAGGAVTTPWAVDPAMKFPNGLILDGDGTLVVADSGGAIFKIATATGAVTTWLTDPTLSAAGATCAFMAPFPIGANGIAKIGAAYYVANTNLAQIVKIPINADGSAGTPALFAGPDCDALGGIDGIAADADGSLVALVNAQNKLIRIGTDAAVTELFAGKPLDNPASVSIATVGGKKMAYITNAAFFDTTAPAPGLLAYPLP